VKRVIDEKLTVRKAALRVLNAVVGRRGVATMEILVMICRPHARPVFEHTAGWGGKHPHVVSERDGIAGADWTVVSIMCCHLHSTPIRKHRNWR
jgi:hypothetical protein